MIRPHGWGRRRRHLGLFACLLLIAGLAAGTSALGASHAIKTVAGNGSAGYNGDGQAATGGKLNTPEGVASTLDGGFLIADYENSRIRRVSPDGTITTVAGTGSAGYNGDGQAATSAKLNKPDGVTALIDGSFLIADTGNNRIRRVDPLGTITTVAGNGNAGYNGDGGAATAAELCSPLSAVPTLDGGFLIADTGNHAVRRVSPLGAISTVAGTGNDGNNGDGGPATAADLGQPDDVAPTADGGFLIADFEQNVVRKVSLLGQISTVAGGPLDPVQLSEPADVEVLPEGGFLIADHGSDRVLHVAGDGTTVTYAGTGTAGYGGDGGDATAAKINDPHALSITPTGDVLIADAANHRIRQVDDDFLNHSSDRPADPATPTSDDPAPSAASPDPEPQLGRSVVVAPGFGHVKVKVPGENRWMDLVEGSSLPVGSVVDTRKGSVVLTTALAGGHSQTGTFWEGVFQVRQAPGGSGMTDISLRGRGPRACPAGRRARPSAVASRRRSARRLWAKDDHGRFRTHGRNSVATTRGTLWYTEDRCAGTLTRVRKGQVVVRRRHHRRGVIVSAGGHYLARASR